MPIATTAATPGSCTAWFLHKFVLAEAGSGNIRSGETSLNRSATPIGFWSNIFCDEEISSMFGRLSLFRRDLFRAGRTQVPAYARRRL
jgi:hypothetical protein